MSAPSRGWKIFAAVFLALEIALLSGCALVDTGGEKMPWWFAELTGSLPSSAPAEPTPPIDEPADPTDPAADAPDTEPVPPPLPLTRPITVYPYCRGVGNPTLLRAESWSYQELMDRPGIQVDLCSYVNYELISHGTVMWGDARYPAERHLFADFPMPAGVTNVAVVIAGRWHTFCLPLYGRLEVEAR